MEAPKELKVEVLVKVTGKFDAYNTSTLSEAKTERGGLAFSEVPLLVNELTTSALSHVSKQLKNRARDYENVEEPKEEEL